MRQRQIIGALQMLCGMGLWALGLALGLIWLGFCVATIVVGVLVYLFAPGAFLWPFNLGIVPGNAMLVMGTANLFGGAGGARNLTGASQGCGSW